MKKIFLSLVIFMFFGVLSAQEVQNEPVAEQNESVAAEEVKVENEAASAEVPAAENQEIEAQNAPQEEKTEPETTEKPAESEPEETKTETPVQAAAPAEPANTAPAQPQQIAAEEPAPAENPEDKKPSKMFYQLSAGLGLGASIFSFRINNDIDFLLKHTKGGTNVYLGLEVDFRYSPYIDDHSIYEIPLQLNFIFDFPLRHHNISRVAIWFSGGIDLAIGYLSYYDYDDYELDDDKDRDSHFKVLAAWGFGVNLLFKNDVTLKLGFDSFYGKYPDLVCVAGYRF